MGYLDVIGIEEARLYLRIDDELNKSDDEITSMVIAACRLVEKETNQLFYSRDITYDLSEGRSVRVYEYPVNSITPASGQTYTEKKYNLYSVIEVSDDQPFTINVGYDDPCNVPEELKQVALALVKLMYYESEEEKPILMAAPSWVKIAIDQNRRFIL